MWRRSFGVPKTGAVAVLALLPAVGICAERPPECAAQSTIAAIQDLYRTGVRETLEEETAGLQQPHERERMRQLARGFLSELKITVTAVVSNGYEPKEKKFSCVGNIKVEAPTARDGGYGVRSEYSTQVTEDDKSKFLISVEEYRPLLKAVISQGFGNYASAKVAAEAAAHPGQQAEFEQKNRQVEESRSGMPASSAEYATGINTLKFKRAGQGFLDFEYVSDAPAGTCSIGGRASIQGSSARFEQGREIGACTISFYFSGDGRLDVSANGGCINHCPPNQHELSGIYGRR